jgi:hypothetical protein
MRLRSGNVSTQWRSAGLQQVGAQVSLTRRKDRRVWRRREGIDPEELWFIVDVAHVK